MNNYNNCVGPFKSTFVLLCYFGLRFIGGIGLTDCFGGGVICCRHNVQLYGRFYSSVQQCGLCSTREDMGKDLGIVIAVKLTKFWAELSYYIHSWSGKTSTSYQMLILAMP